MSGLPYPTTQECVSTNGDKELAMLLVPPPLMDVLANKSKEPLSLASFLRFAKRNVSVGSCCGRVYRAGD